MAPGNSTATPTENTTPTADTVTYSLNNQNAQIHQQLSHRLDQLSKEATFFRNEVKEAKTTTKKRYYQKKLTKSTTEIIRLLSHAQAVVK